MNMNFLEIFLSLLVIISLSKAEEQPEAEHEGLKIETTKKAEQCPRKAKNDDQVSVHYTGYLTNGKEFDSSRKRNQPFVITLGHGMVIPGWEKGLQGMCAGEQRKLTIPPELGTYCKHRGAFHVIATPENTPTKSDFTPKETIDLLFYN